MSLIQYMYTIEVWLVVWCGVVWLVGGSAGLGEWTESGSGIGYLAGLFCF